MQGPRKLKQLEDRAAEKEELKQRVVQLEQELRRLRIMHGMIQHKELVRRSSKLEKMQQKVDDYNQAVQVVEEQKAQIKRLRGVLTENKIEVEAYPEQLQRLKNDFSQLSETLALLEKEHKGLTNTLIELKKGKYEYYEVKSTHESFSSIARLPNIYNDETRTKELTEANRKRVEDLGQLKPHEVLVVPRFEQGPYYTW